MNLTSGKQGLEGRLECTVSDVSGVEMSARFIPSLQTQSESPSIIVSIRILNFSYKGWYFSLLHDWIRRYIYLEFL